ncbi:hypothetical protein NUW58_g4636 [Xylaria curta]|uniref:Uncharacterized protein n=1 Tax=Xylaria curta TaxID=42375 RepID=A0ACC1P5I6_9PEZI|nr:hypothetical protein NUW58_g4636 [Xylaria curta]
MNYYLDPSKGGAETCTVGTVGVLRRKFDTHAIQVNNLRGRENEFNIHTHAFQPCTWEPSTVSLDSDEIKKLIYPEAEEFVKKITKATRVHCISHLIRRNTVEANIEALKKREADVGRDNISDKEVLGNTFPGRYAHIDQSGQGARTLLRDNLPDEAEELTKTRWGTVNLWRPIRTIRRDPLGVCDGRTVDDEDLVPIDLNLPPKNTNSGYEDASRGNGFQTLEVRTNPKHKWYYLSEMQPDEALVFKCYDTKDSSKSRCCHASFQHPQIVDDTPRESMEMRFFVFYENEPLEGL